MKYFVCIYLLCILLYLFTFGKKGKKNRGGLVLLFFALLLAGHAFVDPMSLPDLPIYSSLFEESVKVEGNFVSLMWLNLSYDMEIGYVIFNKLCSYISDDFTYFLILVNFIMLISYFKVIIRYSPYLYLSIILLLLTSYGQSYFVLRQHMAVALLLLTYPSIINRNVKNFIFISFLSFLLHKSSIVWFPIYFIYGIKNNKKLIIALLCSAFILSFAFGQLSAISNYLQIGYGSYIDGEKEGTANYTEFFMAILFLCSFLFFLRKKVLLPGINRLVFIAFTINTIMSFVGVNLGILTRLKFYYFISIIFLVPLAIKFIKSKFIAFLYGFVILFALTIQTFLGANAANFDKMRYCTPSFFSLIFYFLIILLFVKIVNSFYPYANEKNIINN